MTTRTFRLNKLVRDNIVGQHMEQGGEVEHRMLDPAAKQEESIKKIGEELLEFAQTGELSELADAQAVLDQLVEDAGFSQEELEAEKRRKEELNGGFKNGDFIETETWPADHKWAKYYAKEPNRFPEVK